MNANRFPTVVRVLAAVTLYYEAGAKEAPTKVPIDLELQVVP